MGILGKLSQMASAGRIDEMNKLLNEETTSCGYHAKSSELHEKSSRTASAVNKQSHHHNGAETFASFR